MQTYYFYAYDGEVQLGLAEEMELRSIEDARLWATVAYWRYFKYYKSGSHYIAVKDKPIN